MSPNSRICIYKCYACKDTVASYCVLGAPSGRSGLRSLFPRPFLLLFLPAFFLFHKVAFADRIGPGTKKKWGVSPAAAPAWFGFLFPLSLPIPSAVSPCPFASASRDLAWHFCFCFFSWLLSLLRSASNFLILSQTPPTADPSQRPSFQFPIFLFFTCLNWKFQIPFSGALFLFSWHPAPSAPRLVRVIPVSR